MKLPAAVLATLCAVGCEAAYVAEPVYPAQPAEAYEVADPRIETIEHEHVQFATPPNQPAVAPVRTPRQPQAVPAIVPPPSQTPYIDTCPACGMG